MPDTMLILRAMATSALVAGVLVLFAWPWRKSVPRLASVVSVLGVGAGFYVGCLMLGVKPHWPPMEDQDRWLFVLFPAVVAVEVLAALVAWSGWPIWAVRLIVAASAARVLLHNTIYLADLAGHESREWGTGESWLILGAMAAVLLAVWTSLAVLVRRRPGRSVPLALAVACGGTAVAMMLSGYATGGGQTGMALAASLAGVVLASIAFGFLPDLSGVVGVGIVGLFALLVIGCFFAQLVVGHAVLLFLAPTLSWLPELRYVRRLRPWLRGVLRVLLTAVPVAIAVLLAQHKYVEDSAPPAAGAQEPSLDDYMNFGK